MGVEIVGLEKVVQEMRARTRKLQTTSLVVGYSAPYALRVHEDLAMRHPRGGQAKFLEQPMREYSVQIAQVVRDEVAKGSELPRALEEGGLFLLEKSIPLVPVDTGFLRDSWYVRIDKTGQ